MPVLFLAMQEGGKTSLPKHSFLFPAAAPLQAWLGPDIAFSWDICFTESPPPGKY